MESSVIIGVDEAGRGPLFGSVYTSAVILPDENFDKTQLKDSKKYSSEKKRKEVFEYIMINCKYKSIDFLTNHEIDKHNILNATQTSMHNSIRNIIKQLENDNNSESFLNLLNSILILVDGNYFKPFVYYYNDVLYNIKYECVIKGDALHKEISAASILAKVSRDENIKEFVKNNPEYEEKYKLSKNKGYGTKEHRDGIKLHGYSQYHRKSFKLKNI
jgi:ribonuclease HII